METSAARHLKEYIWAIRCFKNLVKFSAKRTLEVKKDIAQNSHIELVHHDNSPSSLVVHFCKNLQTTNIRCPKPPESAPIALIAYECRHDNLGKFVSAFVVRAAPLPKLRSSDLETARSSPTTSTLELATLASHVGFLHEDFR